MHCNFYPRSPCGERRNIDLTDFNKAVFLSTLSLRRATGALKHVHQTEEISIHALLAESDRAPSWRSRMCTRFLSTLSLRRATCRSCHRAADPRDFYPRSPCGERPSQVPTWLGIPNFYPRSPCGERPLFLRCVPMMRRYFYPRSPCGERQRKSGTSSR